MIIGNGLLAKSLKNIEHQHCTLFCSGVSDSLELQQSAFDRESELLLAQPKDQLLLYFSTVSIFNPAKSDSAYILHKKNMEQLVSAHFAEHLILRLPNVVGDAGNPTNLFPYFLHAITDNIPVDIRANAFRHLLGSYDLEKVVSMCINHGLRGEINVCFSSPAPVLDVYLYMCSLLKKEPNFRIKGEESAYTIDNKRFLKILEDTRQLLHSNWQDVVKKYTLESILPGQFS
jgi:nucleoside-diphosphate-sugar epimerase